MNTTNRNFIMWYRDKNKQTKQYSLSSLNKIKQKQKSHKQQANMTTWSSQGSVESLRRWNIKQKQNKHRISSPLRVLFSLKFVFFFPASLLYADTQKFIVNSSFRCHPCGCEGEVGWGITVVMWVVSTTTPKQQLRSKKSFCSFAIYNFYSVV